MKRLLPLFVLFVPIILFAQKKPLDHSVYDGWQSVSEKLISNDGKYVVYTVTPQEGDAELYIQSTNGSNYKKQVPRGYNALITEDSRYAVCKIKPSYKDTRDARIKKKKPEEMPKDSFAVIELGKEAVYKTGKIKSYKTPAESSGWVAFLKEKDAAKSANGGATQKTVDSLKRTIDSLVMLVREIKNVKAGNRDVADAEEDPAAGATATEGTDLVLRNLYHGTEKVFKNVADYFFSDNGQKLLLKISKSAKDSTSKNAVLLYDLKKAKVDTILKGGNDFKAFAISEDGRKVAFLAERDTATKALQKFYQLFVYERGYDSAIVLVDKRTVGMQLGMTVSEHSNVTFSKSGNRLYFGTVPVLAPKDTSLIDIDLVKVDVWHYNDDYLQTQQLFGLQNELKRNYPAVFDFSQNKMLQLGSKAFPSILQTADGDGRYIYTASDTGRRVQTQWSGQSPKDYYVFDVTTGKKTLIKKNFDGQVFPSSTGNYLLLYDAKAKKYLVWNQKGLQNVSVGVKFPLFNEEFDMPDDPNPYGVMGWHQNDSFVYVYDKYDVWKLDVAGKKSPVRMTDFRPEKQQARYLKLDADEKYITANQPLYFKIVDEATKKSGVMVFNSGKANAKWITPFDAYSFTMVQKAKARDAFIYTKESYKQSPDLHFTAIDNAHGADKWQSNGLKDEQLSSINAQQSGYNWGTAELYKWKTFNGKTSTGILYKPEDFDPAKKYPMIIYFYEKLTDGLHTYNAPAPTPSRLNIPFFVSRGYLVFAPDISYTKGQPGKDAYNYIVSGAQALSKNKWVDAKNIGIQGQSWGGYQVASLITQTTMFKAAWAGAPVANMTSAYGGIRWESGVNRQFQYEKGQSRIGASVWERPDLYIANSPLFHLPKVTTPLVIMANDADGAVPWYQGIEMFTAMRRLNKKVWMLNYNGEAHNLVERKNRKDIQIREQEYFDWLLKGEKPAKWITEGVPAVRKGKDWGLEIVD